MISNPQVTFNTIWIIFNPLWNTVSFRLPLLNMTNPMGYLNNGDEICWRPVSDFGEILTVLVTSIPWDRLFLNESDFWSHQDINSVLNIWKKQSEIPRFHYHHCMNTLNFKFIKNEVWPTSCLNRHKNLFYKTPPVLSWLSRKLQISTPEKWKLTR